MYTNDQPINDICHEAGSNTDRKIPQINQLNAGVKQPRKLRKLSCTGGTAGECGQRRD
ncbi:uncharacterized protein PHALS_04383 [Plasmopara halstedii]|uniref:Uncharacterized protein n=1 Tax=Plasmopara halstedii TaxID=4781 RepID=A0A0N7L7M8_PLAHL|nr:uncharacterized protein PHALS_04383 [Plasmopara halstedii]CEG47515.1 hypothetical protein PHALS_04383 [Plasmopara halstedii]|eukprot:XP_024583884.1 hypothetical protein PHALS_04383 [Plasmopara halstedii]